MRWGVFVLLVVLVLVPSGPSAAPAGGTVTGQVVLRKVGKPVRDPQDVWVYLTRLRPYRKAVAVKATIAQRGLNFVPHAQVVPLGSSVAFPNNDSEEHNVFSPSDPRFNLKRYGGGQSKDRTFASEGEYDIYCDIHKDMTAKVKVVDSDFIAKVEHGAFSVTGVSAGTYQVVAWAPDSEEARSAEITVRDGAIVTVPALNVQQGPAKPHTRWDHSPYTIYRP
jgi:plastocyanin